MSSSVGKILVESRDGENRIGVVEFDGKRRSVYLNLVPDAHSGDFVRFRAGFATEQVDGENAGARASGGGAREREPDLTMVRAYRVLSELEPIQLQKLLPLAEEVHFKAGQIIFQAGEPSVHLHLLVSGVVALEEVSGWNAVQVQTLHAGDAMGWSALTGEARTHFQARAITDVSTVAFEGGPMREACERDPVLGYALMKRLLEMVTDRLDALRMKVTEQSAVRTAGTAG
jgi:CRP-like cAMP-binding protein/hydrogenase maturation factor